MRDGLGSNEDVNGSNFAIEWRCRHESGGSETIFVHDGFDSYEQAAKELVEWARDIENVTHFPGYVLTATIIWPGGRNVRPIDADAAKRTTYYVVESNGEHIAREAWLGDALNTAKHASIKAMGASVYRRDSADPDAHEFVCRYSPAGEIAS